MERLRIGLDIDGVLADFTASYQPELNRLSGLNLPLDMEKVDRWHWEESYGYPKAAVRKFWASRGYDNSFWSSLPQCCTTPELIQVCSLTFEHDVYFITTRPFQAAKGTKEWLNDKVRNSGGRHQGSVILTSEKGLIAQGLELHCMVDDKPENLDKIQKASPKTKTLLLNQNWNQPPLPGFNHTRVFSVEQALEYIKGNTCVSLV